LLTPEEGGAIGQKKRDANRKGGGALTAVWEKRVLNQ